DVTVNASIEDRQLRLRIIGTGSWNPVEVSLSSETPTEGFAKARCRISPRQPIDLKLSLGEWSPGSRRLTVKLSHRDGTLAQFEVPMALPMRKKPDKKAAIETAHEHAERGWQHLLLAKLDESESSFREALKKDARSAAARTGLAYLELDADPKAAASEAQAALEVEPDSGLARFVRALA